MTPSHAILAGLVGAGVSPSLTPHLHMAEGRAQGLDYVFQHIDLTTLGVEPERLSEVLDWAERLGFAALNITHPCKRMAFDLVDRIDPLAESLGAINTVIFTDKGRVGYNTDTTGFEAAFRAGMPEARTTRVTQLGAGGAGSAVADALLRLGVRRLSIVDLDEDRAAELVDDLTSRHPDADVECARTAAISILLAESDGVVNCTPLGMPHHPGAPFDTTLLRPDLWVADIVYRPIETELLREAEARGCAVLDGGGMAVFQAVDAFRLITGREPDPDRMMRQFHRLLEDEQRPHE